VVEVRATAEEARAEVARVAEAAGKAALIYYSARANASVDQGKVVVVVAVAVAAAAVVEARVA
jgi:hypothetical protein